MTFQHPREPVIAVLTDEEKAERAQQRALEALDRRTRQRIADRSGHRAGHPDANPYNTAADALFEAIGDAFFLAIEGPDFREALRLRGLALVPAPPEAPAAPADWAEDALDLMGAHGSLADPLGVIDALWAKAWQDGYAARAAAEQEEGADHG